MKKRLSLLFFLFQFTLNAKSQQIVTNIEYFETYEDFLAGEIIETPALTYIDKINEEFIEIGQILNSITSKKSRSLPKAWALKYNNSIFLNNDYLNAPFRPASSIFAKSKILFLKIDSITLNSFFVIIRKNKMLEEGYLNVDPHFNYFDMLMSLNKINVKDSTGVEYLVYFLKKSRAFSPQFSYLSFWKDEYFMFAKIISHAELYSLSNDNYEFYLRIYNKEFDKLEVLLPMLESLP